ncbi:unnamed protein product [Callosobruchus maculatus]|uniref:Uncharacterized protein n=1 Tax=Callosobruchus maculatus TaxID=64391 RepID=A0A653BH20_CALMS|nr:unnamed protein product [Callosobruchus maculatus]
MTDSVNGLRPKLIKGIPELDVPSIEPLPYGTVKVRSAPGTRAKVEANLTNVQIWGLSSYKLLEMKPNLPKNRFVFRLNIPRIECKGDYDVDLNVLILRYKGNGPFRGNLTNIDVEVLVKGKIEKINGKNHMQLSKMLMHIGIGTAHFILDELFSSNPILGRIVDVVVNENTQDFLNEIRPALEVAISNRSLEMANRIFKTVTFDELFPTV